MKIKNSTVVITGAGSGMGRAMTLEVIRRGGRVAAIDLRRENLDETRRLAGTSPNDIELGRIETFHLDITSRDEVSRLPEQITSALGIPDILINNAGIIQPFVRINELSFDDIERVMNVNFYGSVNMIKAFLPVLLKRPHAHILNVSSMGAYAPVPGQSAYGASKAAIKLLTEGLRSELLDTNVGVTIAFPGSIATNIAANSGLVTDSSSQSEIKIKTTSADKAATIMIDAIESNRGRVTVGSDAKFMDRLSRLNPQFAAKLIYRQMRSLLK
jgi:NAD(P)-dependent dehydrogenase (short-subunit alcohol dehydrogenase family)